jgi:hypothetical protein
MFLDVCALLGLFAFVLWMVAAVAIVVVFYRNGGPRLLADARTNPLKKF